MKRLLISVIISTLCSLSVLGQTNIDTLIYEKEGELMASKVGKVITHSRPTWKLKFNIKVGNNVIYRKNGTLYLKGSYSQKEDYSLVKNGKFEYYYKNGQLRDSGFYKNGNRVGLWKHFDKNGTLSFEQNFDTLIRTYFYPNRDTLAFGQMKLLKETNNFEFFNLTEHEGYWEFRNFDGSCDCKGKLVGSLKNGKWFYYSYSKKELVETKKRYPKYVDNYNYDFLELCEWK